jgi:hypothetical protein
VALAAVQAAQSSRGNQGHDLAPHGGVGRDDRHRRVAGSRGEECRVIIAQWNQGTLALAVSSIGLLGAAIATAVGRFNAVNQASEKTRIEMVLGDCHARAEKQDQQITALQDRIIVLEREIERWKVQSEMMNSRLSKGNT